MNTRHYDKLLREAKGYLKDSHENEDGHEIQYDEGYLAGLKDAKKALLKDLKATTVPANRWENNHTQFARLLAEIYRLPLTAAQYEKICEHMDLAGYEDVDELFERASLEWELHLKCGGPVREVTPQKELEAYTDGSSV